MYWFTGIDDQYDFNLLKTALYSAKCNTSLTPVVLYTHLSSTKLNYLQLQKVLTYSVTIDKHIAIGQCNLPEANHGALLKLYVPIVAESMCITNTILYTDVDVLFMSDPPNVSTAQICASSYYPLLKPSHTKSLVECQSYMQMFENGGTVLNAGVIYMNVGQMLGSYDRFMELCRNPRLSNAPAESVYHYFRIDHMPYELNYFAYWNNLWADCEVANLRYPKILHYHGPKPSFKTQPDCLRQYVTKEFENNKQLWLEYSDRCSQEDQSQWFN